MPGLLEQVGDEFGKTIPQLLISKPIASRVKNELFELKTRFLIPPQVLG